MLIIGTFEHSFELEQALAELEQTGIERRYMMVVPMDADPKESFVRTDVSGEQNRKPIEAGMACATACCVIGTSVGFRLAWGPLIWGLISTVIGFAAGFGTFKAVQKSEGRKPPSRLPEVTIIVQCREELSNPVRRIMWRYRAMTVGRLPEPQ
ncbi:hypothetical protein [Paenibacillus flagellatus]|uniref:Uncharacterized protein n=1 Tax=Paenibacillus flagellatus TaxID=2211139 RepID=A0A2V5KTH9_9BACL|nr:hypothetical protein [Paenibacillus flagellatus]PYI52516.1 hypothetical protein DLM86_20280 [Paenibacillus flagellatus]